MAIQNATKVGGLKGKQIKQAIKDVVERPEGFIEDEHFGQFAQDVIADLLRKAQTGVSLSSSHAGSLSSEPSSAAGSSAVKPGPSVAISNSTPPGSLK